MFALIESSGLRDAVVRKGRDRCEECESFKCAICPGFALNVQGRGAGRRRRGQVIVAATPATRRLDVLFAVNCANTAVSSGNGLGSARQTGASAEAGCMCVRGRNVMASPTALLPEPR